MCQCHDIYDDESVSWGHHAAARVAADQCHDLYETAETAESQEMVAMPEPTLV